MKTMTAILIFLFKHGPISRCMVKYARMMKVWLNDSHRKKGRFFGYEFSGKQKINLARVRAEENGPFDPRRWRDMLHVRTGQCSFFIIVFLL